MQASCHAACRWRSVLDWSVHALVLRCLERERCGWPHSAHSLVGGPAARVAALHLIPPGLSGERVSPRAHLTTGRVPTGSAGPPAWLVGRPEAAEAPRETRPKWAEGDPSSRLRRVNGVKPRGAATGRRPDAFGAVYGTFTIREGPEPTPPSRNARVTADFQPSVHLLEFGVSCTSKSTVRPAPCVERPISRDTNY